MTVDVRPKGDAQALEQIAARLYKVEQKASSPGTAGPGGFNDPHPSVETITIDGIVVGSAASPPTGLTLNTGAHMEDIWIDADWTAPVDGTAASYDVELARKIGSSYEIVQNYRTGTGTGIRMHALEPSQTYGVRVKSINRIGEHSDYTPAIGFTDITTGIDATIPAQVTGVSVVAGFKTVMVTWSEVADRDVARGTGVYEIHLDTSNTFPAPLVEFAAGTITSFSDMGTNITYYARVRAIDNSGNAGPWSTTHSDTTGQVGTVDLADVSVTTGKMANLSVDNSKLAALAVDAAKLADSAVTSTKIANLAVGSAAIAALAVGTAKIDDLAVNTAKIGALAVTTAKIADLAVTNAKIENLAVDNAKIANLDAAKINAGTIDANRIAANSIDVAKLTSSTLTSKTITIGSGGVLKIGNPPTTGIFINDQGIRLYSGGVVKVSLDVAGTANFEGNINASTITSSTLTSATINSGTITGVTITGATVRTATSGQRIAFEAGVIDKMKFYTGSGNESAPGELNVGTGTNLVQLGIVSPRATGGHAFCQMTMTAYDISTGDTQFNLIIVNGDGTPKSYLRLYNQGSGETVRFLVGGGWVEDATFDFNRTGTSALIRLKGSGDYSFIYFLGGGAAATINVNIGLGAGIHIMDGTNASFHPIQASAFNVSSSQATKRNITDEESVLAKLMQMKVKRFQRVYDDKMKDAPAHIQRAYDLREVGLMAEELASIEPDAVTMGADGPTGINLAHVVGMLVKAVQELNGQIQEKK